MPDQQTVQTETIDSIEDAGDRAEQYRVALASIKSLCEGETDQIAMMATIACELHHTMPGFDWVGFYRAVGNEILKIGPYQGGHGCLVIPYNRGVCGACARTGETQIVDDVDAFPGHIACSSNTRSEIVLPVRNAQGELIAVLDIDSDSPAHFSTEDATALETMLAEAFSGR
ncbi:MAG: GAF domain-containing protein [Pseudomonadota bacterium]